MGLLELTLLGGFKAELPPRRAVMVGAKKNQALLAYLALNPGRLQGREKLIELLWSDRDNEHGRNSLRQAPTALRKPPSGEPASLRCARQRHLRGPVPDHQNPGRGPCLDGDLPRQGGRRGDRKLGRDPDHSER